MNDISETNGKTPPVSNSGGASPAESRPVSNPADVKKAKKKSLPTVRLTTLSMLIATAMILSYAESRIPAFVAVPGVKIGLANVATVFTLCLLGRKEAVAVSLVRVLLSALLFGSVSTLLYSAAGAVLSLAVMILTERFFTTVGTSVAGGVAHNIGQILAAAFLAGSPAIVGYLPVLLISGTVAGAVIGIASGVLLARLRPALTKKSE